MTFVDIIPDLTLGGNFPQRTFDVDFDGDGTYEVRMDVSVSSTTGFRALPASHAKVQSVDGDPGYYYGWPVYNGEVVGPTPLTPAQWAYSVNGSGLGVCQAFGSTLICLGYFWDFTIASIGVEFTLPDGVHYGVVEVEGIYGLGRIRSYAWETDPGVPIVAGSTPEPSRLLLLTGALAAALLRRRRKLMHSE